MDSIIRDILETSPYWPLAFGIGLLGMAAYIVARKVFGYRNCLNSGMILTFLWASFTILIVSVTIFSRSPGSRSNGIDLRFHLLSSATGLFSIENLLMFIPYGVLLAATFPRTVTWKKCAVICCLFSVAIETVQLLTERGYCQLEDVLLNTAGGLVGWAICTLLVRLIRRRTGENEGATHE